MFGKGKNSEREPGFSRKAADYLARELDRLVSLPIANDAEVKHWYSECGQVQKRLIRKFPEFEFNEEVWHFFADADVRSKDANCRERQHRLISDYITRLRR